MGTELAWYMDSADTLTWDRASSLCAGVGGTLCTYDQICPGGDQTELSASLNPLIAGGVGTTGDNWVPMNDHRCKFVQTSATRQCYVEGGDHTHYCSPNNLGTDPVCQQSWGDICNGVYCCAGASLAGSPYTPSSDGDDDPCFPSSATVTKADGTRTRLDALKEGDAIVAATAEGMLTTDTVSLLSIAKPEARTAFLSLTTSSGHNLTVTSSHHLPTGDACCSNLQKASMVLAGEAIWTVEAGRVMKRTVTRVAEVVATGLHSPVLTNGGMPIVDGVVTSFDSIEKVTLAKHGLAPLLAVCKATGTCGTMRGMFLHEKSQYIA